MLNACGALKLAFRFIGEDDFDVFANKKKKEEEETNKFLDFENRIHFEWLFMSPQIYVCVHFLLLHLHRLNSCFVDILLEKIYNFEYR